MPHSIDHIATILKRSREQHGLSQRELGARAGLPQAHVSKIESGAVDLKASSLIEIARILGLEVMLVPVSLVPAVAALTGPAARAQSPSPGQTEDLKRLAGLLRRWSDIAPADRDRLARLRTLTADLTSIAHDAAANGTIARVLKQLRLARKHAAPTDALRAAASELSALRDRVAQSNAATATATRPAYNLDEDDDDA